jgi:1-deoxy-D-xylulose-5-phosphate synthase
VARTHDLLVTVEEHQLMGGAGSAVAEALSRLGASVELLTLGIPDHFVDHGDPALLLASLGLDRDGIARQIRAKLSQETGSKGG